MPAPIDVRTDFTPDQLNLYADSLQDRAHARRVRAIAAVLQGHTRTEAAKIGGMERQTLRDWVHRFNTCGPDGLKSLRSPGRPPKLDAAQLTQLADIISKGPDQTVHGVRRWRLTDLVRVIRENFAIEHDEVSVGRIMKRMGYSYTGVEWRPKPATRRASDDDAEKQPAVALGPYPAQPREAAAALDC